MDTANAFNLIALRWTTHEHTIIFERHTFEIYGKLSVQANKHTVGCSGSPHKGLGWAWVSSTLTTWIACDIFWILLCNGKMYLPLVVVWVVVFSAELWVWWSNASLPSIPGRSWAGWEPETAGEKSTSYRLKRDHQKISGTAVCY